MKHFFQHLSDVRGKVESILSIDHPMEPLTDEQQLLHDQAILCHTCFTPFTPLNHKVRHHCHVTSSYIGPMCNRCNIKLKPRKFGKAKKKEIGEYVGKVK